jgi:hypothetical protein
MTSAELGSGKSTNNTNTNKILQNTDSSLLSSIAKSPSLADELFPAISESKNTASTSSLSSKNIDQLGLHSPTYPKQKLNTTSLTTTFDNTAELSEHEDDLNSSASLADGEDSKTATLKASQQLDTITVSIGQTRINRFNSDKSIYYSSEHLTDATNNNNSSLLTEQESISSSSSGSNHVSFTMSPQTSLPPVLPPLPPQPSSVPPPLPPLPPALASKYTFNALKTALYLECVEPLNAEPKPVNEAINCETSSLDSGSSCHSFKSKDTGTSTAADYRSERNVKCASICSDSDVFVKEGSHLESDLSGEIYASPTTPADGIGVGSDMIDQVSSLLQAGNANLNGASLMLSLNESSSNSPDASGLLLQIDGKEVGEERRQGGGRLLSRSSTLTPGGNFESVNGGGGQMHRQATICTSGQLNHF